MKRATTGSIEKYDTKRGPKWRAGLKYKNPLTGETVRKSKTFDKRGLAQKWLNEQLNSVTDVAADQMTVATYLTNWLDDLASGDLVRPNTLSGYRGKMQTVIAFMGALPLQAVTSRNIKDWMQSERERGMSDSTIRQSRTILSKAFKDAMQEEPPLVERDPTQGARIKTQKTKARKRVDSIEDGMKFLQAMQETCDGPMTRFLALTGCRRSEAGGLGWSSVDLDAGVITIERTLIRQSVDGKSVWVFDQPKSETSNRIINISAPLRALLTEQRTQLKRARLGMGALWQDHDLVFPDPQGEPQNLDAFSARARRMRTKLGLPAGVQPLHGLRHQFGTQLNAAGTDVKSIQSLLGHSRSTTTLDLYVSPDDDNKRDALDVVGNLFG